MDRPDAVSADVPTWSEDQDGADIVEPFALSAIALPGVMKMANSKEKNLPVFNLAVCNAVFIAGCGDAQKKIVFGGLKKRLYG